MTRDYVLVAGWKGTYAGACRPLACRAKPAVSSLARYEEWHTRKAKTALDAATISTPESATDRCYNWSGAAAAIKVSLLLTGLAAETTFPGIKIRVKVLGTPKKRSDAKMRIFRNP